MQYEFAHISLNLGLLLLIAGRLRVHKAGIFSVGFFALFTGLFPHYIVYPLYMALIGDERVQTPYFSEGLTLVTVLLVGLLLGTLATKSGEIPFVKRFDKIPTPPVTIAVLLAFTVFAIMALLYSFRGSANPYELLENARSTETRVAYIEYNLSYPILFLTASLFLLHALLTLSLFRRYQGSTALGLAVGVTLLVMFVLLSFGSRATFFTPAVTLLFIIHASYKRISLGTATLLFCCAIPIFVFLRLVSASVTLDAVVGREMYRNLQLIATEFIARFHSFSSTVDFFQWFHTQSGGFDLTLQDLFLRPIPRSLLPDKPSSMDIYLTREIYGQVDYGEGRLGGGVHLFGGPVEMYYNFWFPGVAIWSFLLGIALYRVHMGSLELTHSRYYVAVAMVFSNQLLVRGLPTMGINTIGSQQLVMTVFAQIVVLLVFWMLAQVGSREPRAQLTESVPEPVAVGVRRETRSSR